MIRLLITLLMILPVFAWAACWERIDDTENGDINYIDTCSIAIDGIYKKANFKSKLKEVDKIEGKPFNYNIYTAYFNCKNRTIGIKQFVYYFDNVFVGSSDLEEMNFIDIPSDSIGEVKYDKVCNHNKNKKSAIAPSPMIDIPENPCWTDIYSDKEIDIYFDNCSINKLNRIIKKKNERASWIRAVIANSYKINKNTVSDELILLLGTNCKVKDFFVVQASYYSSFPDNKLVYTESASEDKLDFFNLQKHIDKVVNKICTLKK